MHAGAVDVDPRAAAGAVIFLDQPVAVIDEAGDPAPARPARLPQRPSGSQATLAFFAPEAETRRFSES